MLKQKLQYFGRLMQTADSLEKILMLGKSESKRRGWQRLRWLLDGLTSSMGMNSGQFRKVGRDREPGGAAVHGVTKSQTRLKYGTTTVCGIDVNSFFKHLV